MPAENQITTRQAVKGVFAACGLVLLVVLKTHFDISFASTAISLLFMFAVIYAEHTLGYVSSILFYFGQYERALAVAKMGLRIEDQNAYCMVYAAYSLMKLDRGEEASLLLSAMRGERSEPWLLDARGWANFQQGDYERTDDVAEEYIRNAPRAWNGYYMRAMNFMCSGSSLNFSQAEADVEKIIELAPQVTYGYHARSLLRLQTNRIPEAIEDCARALKIEPQNNETRTLLACAYLSSYRYKEAEDIVQDILSNCGRSENEIRANALRVRATLFLCGNMPEAAIRDFEESIYLTPSAKKYTAGLATCFSRVNRGADALAHINEVIEINPRGAASYVIRAAINAKRELHDEALRDLDRAEKLNTFYPHTQSTRAYVHWKAGRFEEALREAEAAIERLETPYALAMKSLALIELGPQQLEQAEICALRAEELDIQGLDADICLGLIAAKRKNFDKALRHLDHVLSIEPTRAEVLKQKASIYRQMGDEKNAELNDLKCRQLKETYMERSPVSE